MRGTGLRVRFQALESALVDSGDHAQTDIQTDIQTDMPRDSVDQAGRLGKRIMVLLKSNPTMTMSDMTRKLDVTSRTIEREASKLRNAKKIARIGGKRFGRWIVL